ncbi:IS66 family transposase zinc-finger binding domain-containing protein [Burkholderia thailandensis]|uniref:IS66 family transposase zinc-finger binding domain-containing protein n=1 Tax=Burkholderia thailandensis TaxID=57975 RepID=UPI001EE1DFB2|nr:IS66 family transposase zinc-finger binding domain-containing protein [Burkholderia thailandensis]
MTAANAYPDDIEALKAMLLERDARIGHLEDVVESHKAANATAKAEIEHLKLLIAKLRRMQFGRKSEKLDRQIEQLELRLEELEADEGAAPIESRRHLVPRRNSRLASRCPSICHVKSKRTLPQSTETCSECGGKLKLLGEDVSEQLEYVPASFRVIRHVRPKFACACCDHRAKQQRRVVPSSAAWRSLTTRARAGLEVRRPHPAVSAVGHVCA